jgi:branched-chain amino acid transport system permease protein
MNRKDHLLWMAVRLGLLAGAVGIYLCLVGMIEIFSKRYVIQDVLNLGVFLLMATWAAAGYLAAGRASQLPGARLPLASVLGSLTAGLVTSLLIAALVLIGPQINLRNIFITASPALYGILTFGQGTPGLLILIGLGGLFGLAGAGLFLLPQRIRRPIVNGILVTLSMALLAGLLNPIMTNLGVVFIRTAEFFFGRLSGLTLQGTLILFFGTVLVTAGWSARGSRIKASYSSMPRKGQTAILLAVSALGLLTILGLPQVSGPFLALVIVTIALYTLAGLGLNITLGLAGLLDLGFVAFFAIGAYTVGLLTSYGPFGLAHLSFWAAAPIAVLVAMTAGIFLGLPVLGIRGDYLAIATLGFGEIVRILAGSDWLAPWLGGPQGIIGIQKPCIGFLGPFIKVDVARVCHGIELGGPVQIYYLAIAGAVLIAIVAWRLRESRVGRAWMAIREDEDVAEALGVFLIQYKILAYMLGAAFAGLGGAIFAVLIGSIFASSMQLFVSINVVALIIVGGMGSIPGVVVGALFLIGLPEALREVSEFRYLFYGIALIAMMQARPEGLWPSQIVRRELHTEEELVEAEASPEAG